ncbi:hypothetical protein Tco_1428729 [Tanacetum coccineum]
MQSICSIHANHFVPRSVILNSGRPNVNSVRPNVNNVQTNINSVRQNVNFVWSNVNTGSFNVNSVRLKQPVPTSNTPNFSSERPQVNKFNQRSNFSIHIHLEIGELLLRPQQDHPLKNMVDRGIFNSGCSGHMTGNKDQLEDFKEFNRGSVTFGVLWNYIPVSLENQANPHASASEVTNSACTLQTLNANASEEKDEDAELIVVPSAVKNTKEKVERGDFDRTSTRE